MLFWQVLTFLLTLCALVNVALSAVSAARNARKVGISEVAAAMVALLGSMGTLIALGLLPIGPSQEWLLPVLLACFLVFSWPINLVLVWCLHLQVHWLPAVMLATGTIVVLRIIRRHSG
jgi:hypothetical protein